jgi:hypothetical protein
MPNARAENPCLEKNEGREISMWRACEWFRTELGMMGGNRKNRDDVRDKQGVVHGIEAHWGETVKIGIKFMRGR